MENKTITVVSNANFALFKGLTQDNLTGDNKAQQNRLNIRPTWSHGLDENGHIQRFDFVNGDNTVPEYVQEWQSFQKMCDNGVLGIKGNYTSRKESTVNLAKLRKLEEDNRLLLEKLTKLEKAEKDSTVTGTKIEEK